MDHSRRMFLKKLTIGGAGVLGAAAGAYWFRHIRQPALDLPESWRPAYAQLAEAGELRQRVEQAYAVMEACTLCPHRCGVNRLKGEVGFCRARDKAVVHSHSAHYGEERPLVGRGGSGTIFFSHCNLRCVFCQNWPIAHEGRGTEVSDEDLAEMMLRLQQRGCHNINVVTPTHMMPHIVHAVELAHKQGLRLPLCYNTGGYELVDKINLLDGIVDIYLPDLKFMDGEYAKRYAVKGVPDYPEKARQAIIAMHRQVGTLLKDGDGVALRGLMVRHLVMPNRVAGTEQFVQWVARELSRDTYVNIMSQYRVEHKAFEYDEIARAITVAEFVEAVEWAQAAGLRHLDERTLSQYAIYQRRGS